MRAGDTPLIEAVRHGRTADVAAQVADGADVNEPTTDGSGYTALMIASQEGHTEVVAMLLAADAEPNRANDDGATFAKFKTSRAPRSQGASVTGPQNRPKSSKSPRMARFRWNRPQNRRRTLAQAS